MMLTLTAWQELCKKPDKNLQNWENKHIAES